MKAMKVQLDDDELKYLFKVLDKTGRGEITYQQFVSEFPEINSNIFIILQHKLICDLYSLIYDKKNKEHFGEQQAVS
jgi:hypothetical protein